jgi:hypothetical protein
MPVALGRLITTIFPRIYARMYYAHPRARVMSFSKNLKQRKDVQRDTQRIKRCCKVFVLESAQSFNKKYHVQVKCRFKTIGMQILQLVHFFQVVTQTANVLSRKTHGTCTHKHGKLEFFIEWVCVRECRSNIGEGTYDSRFFEL